MLYNNKQELQNLLKAENLVAEKKFGQNFLFNTQIIEQILAAANLDKQDHVIEIGPGLGILSLELASKVKQLTVIEKDKKLIDYLEKIFKGLKNVKLIHADVLKTTPPEKPYKVVANIPYYITSPIISHFLTKGISKQPISLTLMTQLEVAQKICAKKGDHTVLSLMTQLFTKPQLVHQVSATNFFPAPKVKSAIIHLETLDKPKITNNTLFTELIKKAFTQKRKNLANSLTGFQGLDKTKTFQLLKKAQIDANSRPQNLDFKDWERIVSSIE